MSDTENAEDAAEVERIRERKLEALKESATGAETPDEPVSFDGESLSAAAADYDVALADFYADWCGPCQMMEPTLETIAADTDAAVIEVDVDENQGVAAEYGARSIPTLVLFADGEPVERTVGVQSEADLRALVADHA